LRNQWPARHRPEVIGSGTLPRKELHEAAEALTAIADTADVTRRFVDTAADEIADELPEALKG
jgi:hypothetical protein